MNEYIERSAIIPALKYYYEPINPNFPMTLGLGQISEILQNMPAADVAPVRHGQWIAFRGGIDKQCSECNWGTDLNIPRKFCPNCGAKMDLEDENEN